MKRRHVGFAVAMLVASATSAREGVIEINQTRALVGGVTAGDTPGFPVTLAAAGSYVLTGALDVRNAPDPNTTEAIVVTADAVRIDLNGFRIVGPVRCNGDPPATPVTCTPTGNSGVGISLESAAGQLPQGVEIRNGTIEGFTFGGINCPTACVIEHVVTRHHEGSGASVSSGSFVREVVAELNSGEGISGGARTFVSDVHVSRNGGAGIRLGPGSVLSSCIASGNGGRGLTTFSLVGDDSASAAYRDCVFVRNNGGNANPQTLGIELGENICGTDAVCP